MNLSLTSRNRHLLRDVRRLLSAIRAADVPDELVPYAKRLSGLCESLERRVNQNLLDLLMGRNEILEDVLSNTQLANGYVKLISRKMATPILRSKPTDRLSLRIISWVHQEHPSTAAYPPAVATDDVSMLPLVELCPIYFFPSVEQETLLYQPLFFHEFGHLLYRCHQRELDDLVFDLQRDIDTLLTPSSHRGDSYSARQRSRREYVVRTWYNWAQELFCDAVGLTIGGPSFLRAFSMYMGSQSKSDFHQGESELGSSTHPVSWLRVKLLLSQAKAGGLLAEANKIEVEWETTANLLGVKEDYHGFYDQSLDFAITRMLEDAIVEVAPRQYLGSEVEESTVFPSPSDNPVILLNRAWTAFFSDGLDYMDWESDAIESWYKATPLSERSNWRG